jgi:ABC-2 type transport system ATP-binding protein
MEEAWAMSAVRAEGLFKRRGRAEVLRGVDLEVPEGSITAVIGPNGAGKTTLLRTLLGLQRPDGGTASVLGRPSDRLGAPDRARIAYVPEHPILVPGMRVHELLRFVAAVHPRWDAAAARRYLDRFHLRAEAPVSHLSPGLRSLLALAVALATRPDLLLLDEPASGLDPVMRRRYLQLLVEEASAERTVVLASQDLPLVERLSDRIALLHEGRIQVAGPLDAVLQAERRLRIAAAPDVGPAIAAVPGVRTLEPDGRGFVATGPVSAQAVRALAKVRAVQDEPLTLEELFWSYVAGNA